MIVNFSTKKKWGYDRAREFAYHVPTILGTPAHPSEGDLPS